VDLRPDGAKGWWRLDSPSSQRLIDIAAGGDEPLGSPLTDSELAAAARHGLLGLMALSEDPFLSGPALAPYARLAARQSAMLTVLRPLLERLAGAGVPATVVKGPAVARWAYRNPGHRTFTDLDLLVPGDRVEQALGVLEVDEHTVAIPPKTPKADKRNVPMVSKSGVRFTLDLHWDLFSYSQLRGCADGAADEGWERASFDSDNPLGPMWRLPEEVLISFLTAHALLDHRFRLILFRDLYEVSLRPSMDWGCYAEFVGKYSLRSVAYVSWLISRRMLGAGIPDPVLSDLRPHSLIVKGVEGLLSRVDPVTFDGHRPHALNLAIVLLHDDRLSRIALLVEAPKALPSWWQRVSPNVRRGPT
jgi:hypothetical protein